MAKNIFFVMLFLAIFGLYNSCFFVKWILQGVFLWVNPSKIEVVTIEHLQKFNNYHLLDVRTQYEFDIAHLPNAENVTDNNLEQKNSIYSKIDTLVLYCSVGYRSGLLAQNFKKQGFKYVFNLQGGIFEAKNKNYSLVNKQNIKTDSIHVFNKYWGFLVHNGIKIH